jgi:hypothetical protein
MLTIRGNYGNSPSLLRLPQNVITSQKGNTSLSLERRSGFVAGPILFRTIIIEKDFGKTPVFGIFFTYFCFSVQSGQDP